MRGNESGRRIERERDRKRERERVGKKRDRGKKER